MKLNELAAVVRFTSEYFWESSRTDRDKWRSELDVDSTARNPLGAMQTAQDMLIDYALNPPEDM
jgi:hypothetical protein